jgi:hypothetical protein
MGHEAAAVTSARGTADREITVGLLDILMGFAIGVNRQRAGMQKGSFKREKKRGKEKGMQFFFEPQTKADGPRDRRFLRL